MATIPRGTQIRRYEIETLVGAGGMGEVYRARDVELDRTVALKILRDADERRFIQEGRAAIALNHPHIAHLYDLGEERGLRFMAMEYVEGETLRARMHRKPLTMEEAIEIAIQIASALGSAHGAGIIHRDVKPDNVMLRHDGYVKVLDFGLARLPLRGDMSAITAAGFTVGTIEYMSPEQLRGDEVDGRTDLYSLGVMLREMAGDAKPLQSVIARATAKNREERFASAEEFIDALKGVSSRAQSRDPLRLLVARLVGRGSLDFARDDTARRRPLARWLALVPVAAVVIVYVTSVRTKPVVHAPLSPRASESLSVLTTPPGAQVFLERVTRDGNTEPRVLAGTTPLDKHALPRGDYVITVEKAGFAPVTRTISLRATKIQGGLIPPRPMTLDWTLSRREDVPEEMALVPGGTYRLAGWARPTHRAAELDPFLIDRFEVTNRDFARFISAGGYQRRELWKHPFVNDGRTLTFDEALKLFIDTTGLNAPRHWSGQTYPPGLENHPVTHVSWYEAAAFAEFSGKSLPTIFQWNKAARDGRVMPFGPVFPWGLAAAGHDALRRANFRGEGTMPVDSLRSGISPYGAHHMAGNVAEWCLNVIDGGRAVTGGAYDTPVYQFAAHGAYPPFYSSASLGFRCARVAGTPRADQGAFAISVASEVPKLKPAGDAEFARIAKFYAYEKTPLGARVLERRAGDGWTTELIELEGTSGDRARAYLLLPKNGTPPFEVIHYVPPADVWAGIRTLEHSMTLNLGPQVRAGRAVFAVLLRGYIGREARVSLPMLDRRTVAYADAAAEHITEMRRGLDYLETRPDLDTTRLGLFAPSGGGTLAIILAGVDRRHRSTLLFGAGIGPHVEETIAEANRVNFAPRIAGPKLMLHGRWDESTPLATDAKPLYAILSEPKRMIVYEAGHIPPPDVLVRETRKWFDETLTGNRGPRDSRSR